MARAARNTDTPQRCATSDAQRRAAVILEVLAGIRTAQQAAQVLKISVNHYYLLERKALGGLVAACEPAPRRGPRPDAQRQLEQLQRELARVQQECQRQAALVRATQRAVGVPVTAEADSAARGKARRAGNGKARRRRREPRAARAARALRKTVAAQEGSAVQPTVAEQPSSQGALSKEESDESART